MLEEAYRKYFCLYIDKFLKVKEFDDMIKNSDLYFGVSTQASKECREMFDTDYIRCLNNFYIEKVNDNYKNILLDENLSVDGKFSVIKETINDVITSNKLHYITYGFVVEERMVENPSIVLEIVYGKNSEKLEGKEYIENSKKQRELLAYIVSQIESRCISALGIKCRVLIQREV